MKNVSIVGFTLSFLLAGLFYSSATFAITKCQDAQGKWHYGDYALEVCANSELTELNDRGFIVDKTSAPKTEEEIAQELQQTELEEQQKAHQLAEQAEKERILNIYETEADIDRIRDNQMNSVQSNIEVHKAYLKSVNGRIEKYKTERKSMKTPAAVERMDKRIAKAEENIALYTRELDLLKEQKAEITMKFEKEKALYKMLKEQPQDQAVH